MRYPKLFFQLIKNNLIREIEFRGQFFMFIIIDFFWVALQIVVIEVFFLYTPAILDWSKAEVLALVGIFRIIKGFFDVFLRPNLTELSETISRGELDYSLTKPVDSQFLISTRRHQLHEISSFILGIAILFYALRTSDIAFTPWLWPTVFFVSALGILAFYSLIFIFATLSVFLVRLTAIRSIYDMVVNVRFPTDTISYGNKFLGLLITPLAIISTVPAKIILGKNPWWNLLLEICLSAIIFASARVFWFFALRRYSSASS